jgi:hypothetical protein
VRSRARVNDFGAIVGTATYTPKPPTTPPGPPDPIAAGLHGVLLLPVSVTSVSFDGTKYWQLESDDTSTQYSAPQWTDNNGNYNASDPGEHNYAVAYTRNTKPKIGATFKIPGASNWTNLKFKAAGPDGISIPATAGTVGTDGIMVTMPVTERTTSLPNTVKFYNWADSTSFTLNWSMSVDGGTTWATINSTKHSVYVTLADPLTPSSERQLTLFDTACRQATGLSATADVVAKVYSVFTHKDSNGIPDVELINPATSQPNGTELTYWSTTNPAPQPECWSTAGLLSIGDGRCGAWAQFFCDALAVDGITSTVETVNPPENNPGTSPSLYAAAQTKLSADITAYLPSGTYQVIPIFYVKSWNLSTYSTAPFSPVRNTGVAGQGNANPRAEFDNHAIVEYSGSDYDPSYGSPVFSSRVNWEDASLEGYGAYVINSTSGTEYKWIWKSDPKGTQETIFQP